MNNFKIKVGFKSKGTRLIKKIGNDLISDGVSKVRITKVEELLNTWYHLNIETPRDAQEVVNVIQYYGCRNCYWE